MSTQVKTEIAFIDGTSLVLEHPRQATGSVEAILAHIDEALSADKLLVEADGRLLVIPVRNVKFIELSPPPQTLPSSVVRGARLLSRA